MPLTLTAAQAARVMLAAQGFGRPRPARPTMAHVQRVIDQLGQFQIDSVNVVARAHYLPLFSRLGGYDPALLDRAMGRAPRRLFEYWGHAACAIDVRLQPALRHKMAAASQDAWGSMKRIQAEAPGLVEAALAGVDAHGPATAREIEARIDAPERGAKDNWGWNWSHTKQALEWLFWSGQISSAGRNEAFERRYDLPERVLPKGLAAAPTPTVEQAHRELVARAAQALGVTTLDWAAEYFRVDKRAAAVAIAELVASGELLPVEVPGWRKPAWCWHEARVPRSIKAQALICPFDPLLFDRGRLRQVFGFDYTIEIYVPAPKRRFGYYVYPLLLGQSFAARVDLKADRQAGVLRVQAAWAEPGHPAGPDAVLSALVEELRAMAVWLGLPSVEATGAGDLGPGLTQALGLPA